MRNRTLLLALTLAAAGVSSLALARQGKLAPSAAAQPGEVASLAELPADIRLVIGPDVSDRGGPFAPGCVSPNGEPHSRFAGARMHASTARVTIERGGIAHYFDTLDFRLANGRWVHVPNPPGQQASLPSPAK